MKIYVEDLIRKLESEIRFNQDKVEKLKEAGLTAYHDFYRLQGKISEKYSVIERLKYIVETSMDDNDLV